VHMFVIELYRHLNSACLHEHPGAFMLSLGQRNNTFHANNTKNAPNCSDLFQGHCRSGPVATVSLHRSLDLVPRPADLLRNLQMSSLGPDHDCGAALVGIPLRRALVRVAAHACAIHAGLLWFRTFRVRPS
jgi:hypothetical protein